MGKKSRKKRSASLDARYERGLARLAAGRPEEALSELQRVADARPDDVEVQRNLASALFALRRLHEAETALRRVLELDPSLAQAWVDLSTVLSALGRPGEPMRAALRATELAPDDLGHRAHLGLVLVDQGHLDLAESTFRNALAVDPGHEECAIGLAMALERKGDLPGARELLQPLIDGGTTVARAAALYGSICRRTGEPGRAIPAIRTALAAPQAPAAIPQLEHELGQLLSAEGDTDGAFEAHTRGNRALGATFDPAAHLATVEATERAFDEHALATLHRSAEPAPGTVLIVGMMRSGTSLLENVLAAHPQVHGAGEREELRHAGLQLARAVGRPFPAAVAGLTADTATQLGRWYQARLRVGAGDATRIIDKLPHNLFNVGLAALLLPGARVLHSVRDPLDTCWSCYRQNFRDFHAWTTDQAWLAAYYNAYRRMMRHWEEVQPLPMMTVRYELLVDDPEPVVRELLDFLDLPFDEACLDHARTRRQVHTASYAQANKPIYRSSVGRAEPYRKQLQPLIEALED